MRFFDEEDPTVKKIWFTSIATGVSLTLIGVALVVPLPTIGTIFFTLGIMINVLSGFFFILTQILKPDITQIDPHQQPAPGQ